MKQTYPNTFKHINKENKTYFKYYKYTWLFSLKLQCSMKYPAYLKKMINGCCICYDCDVENYNKKTAGFKPRRDPSLEKTETLYNSSI